MADEVDYDDFEEDGRPKDNVGDEEEDPEAAEMQRKIAEMDNELADISTAPAAVEGKLNEVANLLNNAREI